MIQPAPATRARPLDARVTFALFALILALHFAAATVGWHKDALAGNTFRQTQTAIATYFIQQEPGLPLAYPTPVLGKPWAIPMEFPLYQWAVVAANHLTGGSLVASARLVSLMCFYLALPGLWLLLREAGVEPARRWIVGAFVLVCPVYVFYSRAFLIESMALMFSVWFLAASYAGLRRGHRGWLAAAFATGTAAILVKVSTFLLFLVPVGGAFAWQAWLALRGPEAGRPSARHWLRQAVVTLVPVAVIGAAWFLYTDTVKARNPAADMLTAGPLRLYNFGRLADRFAGDYWTRWLNLSTQAAIHPAVFVAVLLAAFLGPRRWRGWVLGGLALFLLAPLVFPFLYAWHDYYYYANAGFIAVAAGFAAVGVLDSRLPRWLGVLLIVGALLLQARLFTTRYLPDQRGEGNGDSGLTQILSDLTDPNDVLVVAGQDWSSELPWETRRRALMIRHGFETNTVYLQRAFQDLHGEFVAVLILTGDTRSNAALLALAETRLNIHPEPFLEYRDSVVYVNRALRDEWSGRASGFAYDHVSVLRRNEAAPPGLSGEVKNLHGKAVFSGLSPQPVRFQVPFTLATLGPTTQHMLNTHAITRLWFELPPGQRHAQLEYGILDSAWQNAGKTDGVDFLLLAESAGGHTRPLWRRLLDPANVVGDRGHQSASINFELKPGERLILATGPGPSGAIAFDWAYVTSFEAR